MTIEYPNENDRQAPGKSPASSETTGIAPEVKINNFHAWRKWSLIASPVIVLILIGWWYYSSQLKNSLPPVEENIIASENDVITNDQETIEQEDLVEEDLFDENRIMGYKIKEGYELNLSQTITLGDLSKSENLFNILNQLLTPIILCVDKGQKLNLPKSKESLCSNSDTFWPDLPENFYWDSENFDSNIDNFTYNFAVRSNQGINIECSQLGCVLDEYYKRNETLDNDVRTFDADEDGLSGRDEFVIWNTDVNIKDTDGDGYQDGEEIKNGYNPIGQGELYRITENQDISYESPQSVLNVLAMTMNNLDIELFINSVSDDFWERKKEFITKDNTTELRNLLEDISSSGKVFFAIIPEDSLQSSKGNYYYVSVRIFLNGNDVTEFAKGENHILLEKELDNWKIGDIDLVIKKS